MFIRGTEIDDSVLNNAFSELQRICIAKFNLFHAELVLIRLDVQTKLSEDVAHQLVKKFEEEGKIYLKDGFWHYTD